MDLCILCDKVLVDESPEHVILDAFGGRKTTTRVLCTVCNHRLGDDVDKPFAEAFAVIRNMTNTRSGSGDPPPTLRNVQLADGTEIDVFPGYKPVQKRVVYLRDKQTGQVKVGIASIEVLAAQIDNFAKGVSLTREEFLEKIATIEAVIESRYLPDMIRWQFQFGGVAQERSVTKAALVLWSLYTSNDAVRAVAYERARRFVAKGLLEPKLPWVARLTFASPPVRPRGASPGEFGHLLLVWADGSGRVSGFYQLFGQIGFALRLADGAGSFVGGVALWQNPLTGQWAEVTMPAGDVPHCSLIDGMSTKADEGEAAFHRLMQLVVAKHRRESNEELVGKAVARAMPGEGETIEDTHLASLARDIAEHVVASVFGGVTSNKLSGEVIAAQLRNIVGDARAQLRQTEIAEAAYLRWIERGCVHGHDLEDWSEAERQMRISAQSVRSA